MPTKSEILASLADSRRRTLELLAPVRIWDGVARVISLEDHLKRSVRKNDDDFTADWAEAELAR